MKFGKRILTCQFTPWSPYYLDYKRLKRVLDADDSDEGHKRSASNASALSVFTRLSRTSASNYDSSNPRSRRFMHELDIEIEKIVLFFLREQGILSDQLTQLNMEHASQLHASERQIAQLREQYQTLGVNLLHLIQFIDLNVTGIRKIIKKHDKASHRAVSPIYFGARQDCHRSMRLQALLQNDSLRALSVILETSLRELQEGGSLVGIPTSLFVSEQSVPDKASLLVLDLHPPSISTCDDVSSESHLPHPDDKILCQIRSALQRLRESSSFVQMLAVSAMLVPTESQEEWDAITEVQVVRPSDHSISRLLNLASSFLYMTNYYIIVPTAGGYAEKLGTHSSFSSLIVGMTPAAALVSTLLYSWWTTHSYKSALIFASSCCVLGNFCYAMALPAHRLELVLIGRLLTGFGSARAINRRYIADSFSRADLTAASAAFVSAGALGMAVGPAVASLLHATASSGLSPYWQVENAPGWFMCTSWTVYLVALIFFFQDPPRRPSARVRQEVELTGESEPLIKSTFSNDDPKHDVPPKGTNITPIAINFLVCFVLKLLLECVLSSTTLLTSFYFHWSPSVSGIYLAGMGTLMLPANFVVALLSKAYEDRDLLVTLQIVMLLGCMVILQYTHRYWVSQYVIGSMLIFMSTNMLEGINTSLLSKIIPKSWSRGFFNVGLLATEAGTLGRAIGDAVLTVGGANGIDVLLNTTFSTMGAISFATLLASMWHYESLSPEDDDDDDDDKED